MYQVIARKYRPQSFAELLGQEHVRVTLANALGQGRIAHGYIFSGQRGTGKTTVARIMARCLNCLQGPTLEPCGVCASCTEVAAGSSVDVIEIDAASNRGINEMRELRESVRYRPARDRYKVFIIDEAHQITNEAFNALLKTLEEPPEWVVFILCTTESHKIPTTIASRCQQFSFRSVDFSQLIDRMRYICELEGIQADQEALAVIAQAGEGSVRDSLSALDQAIAACGTNLQASEVRSLLGLYSMDLMGDVASSLAAADARALLLQVQELERTGQSLQHFAREWARTVRNLLVTKISGPDTDLVAASPREREQLADLAGRFSEEDLTRYLQLSLDLFRDLQFSLQPRLHLELGLVRMVQAGKLMPLEQALASLQPGASAGAATPVPATPGAEPKPVAKPFGSPAAGPSNPVSPRPFSQSPKPATVGPRPSGPVPRASVAAAPAPARSQPEPPAPPVPVVVPPPPAAEPATTPYAGGSGLRATLLHYLRETGQTFTADGVEASEVQDHGAEVHFVTPPDQKMFMKVADLEKALLGATQRKVRVKVTIGTPVGVPAPSESAGPAQENDTAERALSHPEVQRYQALFPDSRVSGVRNLKE